MWTAPKVRIESGFLVLLGKGHASGATAPLCNLCILILGDEINLDIWAEDQVAAVDEVQWLI